MYLWHTTLGPPIVSSHVQERSKVSITLRNRKQKQSPIPSSRLEPAQSENKQGIERK